MASSKSASRLTTSDSYATIATMTALSELNREIERCQDCELAKQRTRTVPGEGPENAGLFFIGEAPGWYEDQQGRPFVGAAGQFLEELLADIGLRRNQVFIGNVIKCRPPNNREPLPGEIQACCKWLDRQLEIIFPKVVVTLGRYSLAHFIPGESISKIHGKPRRIGEIILYPMYHQQRHSIKGVCVRLSKPTCSKLKRFWLRLRK